MPLDLTTCNGRELTKLFTLLADAQKQELCAHCDTVSFDLSQNLGELQILDYFSLCTELLAIPIQN